MILPICQGQVLHDLDPDPAMLSRRHFAGSLDSRIPPAQMCEVQDLEFSLGSYTHLLGFAVKRAHVSMPQSGFF